MPPSIQGDLIDMVLRKQDAKDIADRAREVEKEVLDWMQTNSVPSFSIPKAGDGNRYDATLVQGHTTTVDDAGLLAVLTPAQAAMVTRTVIDHKMLEDAIVNGDIPADLAEKFTTEKPKAPYVLGKKK